MHSFIFFKMRFAWFAIVILILSANISVAEYFNDKGYVKMNLSISSELGISKKSSEYLINYIHAHMYFFPENNYMQEVMSLLTIPHAKLEDGSLLFEWMSPDPKNIRFGYDSDILVMNQAPRVKYKIQYPIMQTFDSEVFNYTLPTENIDSNDPNIVMLASSLAEGEDDLYIIANKLASWTRKNIQYNLSTFTASVSKSASWTLRNRQGVCDELTSLFIAMARSLGIPARFIAGISYTSSELFTQNWGPHGWAEVYFPGVGWIPFDPTYGQYGFIDPSHIVLKVSYDPGEATSKFEWKSRNVDIRPIGNLEVEVDAYEIGGQVEMPILLKGNVLNNAIGFGSYQLVEVTATNIMDHYIATNLHIFVPKEVEVIGNDEFSIAIEPKGEQMIHFVLRVEEDLDETLIYKFPIKILSTRNKSLDLGFKSYIEYSKISHDKVIKILNQKQEEREKTYSADVVMNCSIDKNIIYIDDNIKMYCYLRNTGNTVLSNVSMCLDEDCRNNSLGINQAFQESFEFRAEEAGIQDISIFARSPDFSRLSLVELNVLDKPDIRIFNASAPGEIGYAENFKFSFALSKNSNSNPKNVTVLLMVGGIDKQWLIEELKTDQNFVIDMNSRNMYLGMNKIFVNVEYYDENQRKYSISQETFIELVDVNLFQKIMIKIYSSINKVGMLIGGLFT